MPGLFAPSQIDPYLNQVNQNNFPGGNTNGAINPNVQPQAVQQPAAQQPANPEEDAMNALAQQQQIPKYTGDPTVDRYIHMFIGGQ